MDVVFDMDGVIVDTEYAVRQAYLEVGVTSPDRVLGYEGTTWFHEAHTGRADATETEQRYALKHLAYLRRLKNDACAPLLPPFAVASQLQDEDHHVYVLTGARSPAVGVLRDRLERWPFTGARDGLRTPDKMMFIRGLRRDCCGTGVYVDDQDRFIDLPEDWTFIRYEGQTARELYGQIKRSTEPGE